ncbi:MAG: protein kinase, partial [Thermoguttaceae bacterium]
MREPPPAKLAALLTQLGLATDRDLESVETAVHRMAGDLPRFESVWIDALQQARILTHFQAAEIHAGRGETLKVARYVMCQSVQECDYATVYRALDRQSREVVRLDLFFPQDHDQGRLLPQLEKLIAIGKSLPGSAGMIQAGGLDGSRFWASSSWVDGTSLADFVLHHGRFPPQVVLEIARAMLSELAALEAANLVHGDIRVQNVLIARDGDACIPHPGLRGVIRPHEGIAYQDLVPDACGTLSPERVTDGTPPTVASDLFACGCVWWHMLCGRPPLGCGDTLARLRAAQAAAVDDLHQWVADVPDVLVEAICDCLQKDPRKRPKSMAELAQRLGPLRRHGRQAIARCLVATARPRAPWLRSKRAAVKKAAHPHRFTAAALAVFAALAVAWPIWVAHNKPRTYTDIAGHAEPADTNSQPGRNGTSGETASRKLPPRPIMDRAVTPAGYSDAIGKTGSTAETANEDHSVGRIGNPSYDRRIPSEPRVELRLPTDRPVRGELLQLKPGQCVRPQGGRARIVVPREGLAVQADRASFENVDFVVEERADLRTIRDEASPALIRLLAAECEFMGCSFQSATGSPELSAAIVWQ